MADNIASGVASSVLGLLLNGSAFAGFAATYAQLHTGAPGSAGSAAIAGNSVRQAAGAFSGSGGSMTNSGAITWTSVSTSETYSHVSLWSASSGGTFIASGSITAGAILAGQNFQIPVGGMSVTLPVAS